MQKREKSAKRETRRSEKSKERKKKEKERERARTWDHRSADGAFIWCAYAEAGAAAAAGARRAVMATSGRWQWHRRPFTVFHAVG